MIDHPLLKNFFLSLTIISVPYVVLAEKSELWITPMTEYGHPDLQGSWTNPYQTPPERPTELGGQRAYTHEQAQALIDYARELDAARREPLDPNRSPRKPERELIIRQTETLKSCQRKWR